jgi:hypothetical protein
MNIVPITAVVTHKIMYDVLLGMDFLTANNAILNFADNTLLLSSDSFALDSSGCWIKTSIGSAHSSSAVAVNMDPDEVRLNNLNPQEEQPDAVLIVTTAMNSMKLEQRPPQNILNKLFSLVSHFEGQLSGLGRILGFEHEIHLTQAAPIKLRPYRVPYALSDRVQAHVDELLRANIIRPSRSPYGSPAFPLVKKNGDIRLLIDYRKLNAITIRTPYPNKHMMYRLQGIA